MRLRLPALLASLALLPAGLHALADDGLEPKPADLHAALAAWLAEPLALEAEIRHERIGERTSPPYRQRYVGNTPTLLEANVEATRAFAVTRSGPLDLEFVRDERGPRLHLPPRPRGGVRVGVHDGDNPWRKVDPQDPDPDFGALTEDLGVLLDLRGLVAWLRAQSDWYAPGPRRLLAAAKAETGGAGWGAVTRLEVEARLSRRGVLEELVFRVRRDLARDAGSPTQSAQRGDPARWRTPFPHAPLLPPAQIAGPTLPEGHRDAVDPAHERSTYTLRPSWQPPSQRLLSLKAGAAQRR